ncbi:Uncharacterised protein [Vibrio cholerae]|nr:Uncharacterised protein [Vibrio cholerae]
MLIKECAVHLVYCAEVVEIFDEYGHFHNVTDG